MTNGRQRNEPATRLIIRALVYYAVLLGGSALLWRYHPRGSAFTPTSLDALLGGAPLADVRKGGTPPALDEVSLALTVGIAMLAAVLLAIPVAWVYLLTRAKRGYQQSVVHILIILPTVVAGIVLLVKYSLALAFSLAGIVAAVRFRNTLDDSKDAVYVFLATAIGLASAVNLPVAAVLSIGFNTVVLALWYTDFGSSPMELDGRIAEKRLKRAKQLARTGTFVARIDDEVFRNMTRDQLESVAEKAWRRAQDDDDDPANSREARIRIRTRNMIATREAVEPRLEDETKDWRLVAAESKDGVEVLDYVVHFRKKRSAEDLLAVVRATSAPQFIDVEVL